MLYDCVMVGRPTPVDADIEVRIDSLRRFGAGRDARYCRATITKADAVGIAADLEILDAAGDVVVEITGLRLGTGTTKAGERERVLAERLLTVGWEQRQPPTDVTAGTGEWLVISVGDVGDLAGELSDALCAAGAACRVTGSAEDVRGSADISGVVVVTATGDSEPGTECLSRGSELVGQVVRIARTLAEDEAHPPRLYVITRNAQDVTPQDRLNLDQGGMRGLLRVQWREWEAAQALMWQAITLKPDFVGAWNQRATLHFTMGNYKKSVSDIERVLKLEPRHFGALAGLAGILTERGSKQAALHAWERYLDIYPADREAQEIVSKLSEELAGQRT